MLAQPDEAPQERSSRRPKVLAKRAASGEVKSVRH